MTALRRTLTAVRPLVNDMESDSSSSEFITSWPCKIDLSSVPEAREMCYMLRKVAQLDGEIDQVRIYNTRLLLR